MFEHFTYLTQRDFEYRVYCLKEYVFHILSGCSQDKIIIVFSESSKGYKSGSSQMSAAWWKACGGEMSKSQLVEAYSKVTSFKQRHMPISVTPEGDRADNGAKISGWVKWDSMGITCLKMFSDRCIPQTRSREVKNLTDVSPPVNVWKGKWEIWEKRKFCFYSVACWQWSVPWQWGRCRFTARILH